MNILVRQKGKKSWNFDRFWTFLDVFCCFSTLFNDFFSTFWQNLTIGRRFRTKNAFFRMFRRLFRIQDYFWRRLFFGSAGLDTRSDKYLILTVGLAGGADPAYLSVSLAGVKLPLLRLSNYLILTFGPKF